MTITLTAGVSLGAVHAITEEPIAAQEKKKKEDACKAVFPEAETFEAWEEFDEEKAEELAAAVEELYPDCEVELNRGGQPIYYYIISVE